VRAVSNLSAAAVILGELSVLGPDAKGPFVREKTRSRLSQGESAGSNRRVRLSAAREY
jgi:hypothetical protein